MQIQFLAEIEQHLSKPYFFFPLFFFTWFFVLKMLSFSSGWSKLAEKFHHQDKFEGNLSRFHSAKLKGVRFRNCLKIGTNEDGLYLAQTILGRLFHKPILIPWEELKSKTLKKSLQKSPNRKTYKLKVKSVPDVTIEFRYRAFDQIKNYI